MPNPSNSPANPVTSVDLVVRGKRVVTPEGERRAAIHIRAGTIAAVSEFNEIPAGCAIYEAGDSIVMPGIVDTHVHINEPGRTEWEGFSSATRAAAAGGVTTLIEMPLNSIPATTTAAAYREKLAAASGKIVGGRGILGRRGAGKRFRVAAVVGSGRIRLQMFSGAERRRRIRACLGGRSARSVAGACCAWRAASCACGAAGTDRRSPEKTSAGRLGAKLCKKLCNLAGFASMRSRERSDCSSPAPRARIRRADSRCPSVFVRAQFRNSWRQSRTDSTSAWKRARTI